MTFFLVRAKKLAMAALAVALVLAAACGGSPDAQVRLIPDGATAVGYVDIVAIKASPVLEPMIARDFGDAIEDERTWDEIQKVMGFDLRNADRAEFFLSAAPDTDFAGLALYGAFDEAAFEAAMSDAAQSEHRGFSIYSFDEDLQESLDEATRVRPLPNETQEQYMMRTDQRGMGAMQLLGGLLTLAVATQGGMGSLPSSFYFSMLDASTVGFGSDAGLKAMIDLSAGEGVAASGRIIEALDGLDDHAIGLVSEIPESNLTETLGPGGLGVLGGLGGFGGFPLDFLDAIDLFGSVIELGEDAVTVVVIADFGDEELAAATNDLLEGAIGMSDAFGEIPPELAQLIDGLEISLDGERVSVRIAIPPALLE